MTTNTRYRSRIGSYYRANIPPEERAKLDKQLEEFAVPQREARREPSKNEDLTKRSTKKEPGFTAWCAMSRARFLKQNARRS